MFNICLIQHSCTYVEGEGKFVPVASHILGLFDTEDGGDRFLRNIGWFSTDFTALYPRR
jgi:hypothetical protein